MARRRRKRSPTRPIHRDDETTSVIDATLLAIDVAEASALWRDSLPDVDHLCIDAARAALIGAEVFDGLAELGIVLGDDRLLRSLNNRWRGQDKATNVLAFPAVAPEVPDGAPRLLGDVVLAYETVHAEAVAQSKPLAHHLGHLVIHGVLHLLGFDHETVAEAERMEALETAALARLGVPDPYRVSEAADG